MAPPKRKRPHDEDEAAQAGKTRRVTRQTSFPPPPLSAPRRDEQRRRRRRVLRGSTGVLAEASGEEPDEQPTARTARRARRAMMDKQTEPQLVPTRRQRRGSLGPAAAPVLSGRSSRSGRTLPVTRGGPRRTRRAAAEEDAAEEIADSEADEAVDKTGDDDDAGEDDNDEEDTEDELSGPASVILPRPRAGAPPGPSAIRRPTRSSAQQQPAVTPASLPTIPPAKATIREIVPPSPPAAAPRKETSIQPPAHPVPGPPTTTAAARPRKVTEIKPPGAPRYSKATPVQTPAVPVSPTRLPHRPPHPPAPPEAQAPLPKTKETVPSPRLQQPAGRAPRMAATSNAARPATTPTSATSMIATSAVPPPSPGQPDRNIDKVVLGEICFKAWYPSYYGKEVLGETAGHAQQHAHGHGHGGKDKDAPPMLDRLYVCPFCFKYSKEIVPWHGHVQVCEAGFSIPGEKVYVHPKGVRTVRVPVSPTTPKGKRRRAGGAGSGSEADVHYVEQVVKDEGEWSIWEVDGEKDVLFCQNLSLFAKLFLDNKSVFFDVGGFYYFLLVYTPPPSLPSSLRAAATATASPMGAGAGGAGASGQASILGAAPRPRVVGFFSKEKMSWDNNNLACILVFPPWQRKGLGALLMGVSYEISRREGVLGGPEKPISDLGRKGYKRFWGSEIARWLLSIDIATATSSSSSAVPPPTAIPPPVIPPPYAREPPTAGAKGRHAAAGSGADESLIIDIDDCSRATWIVREDCLGVLREMGIVEDAGMGPPKKYCDNVLAPVDEHASSSADAGAAGAAAGAAGAAGAASSGAPSSTVGTAGAQAANGAASGLLSMSAPAAVDADPPREVQRVRLSKAAVRQWVKDNHISLEKACDPAGFIKIYTDKDETQHAGEEA